MAENDRYEPDTLLEEARRQRLQVESMTAPLNETTFATRPGPERWSVGECVEHLALINSIYVDAIGDAVAQAHGAGLLRAEDRRAGRHGWLGDAFVRSLEPPPKVKGAALKRTVPTQRPKSAVVPHFLEAQDRLIRTIDESRDLDLVRVRMRSPFFKLLKLSLGQAFGAVLAHNRRHIWQADGVLALLASNPHRRG